MLDARAPLAPSACARLQRVECSPHRAVTDCVQAYVELGADAAVDHVDQLRLREPRGARAVQHLGGAAAERSVKKGLDAPEPKPDVAPSRAHSHALGVAQVGKGKVVRDAERQLAACMKSLQRREAARAVHGMDAGEPKPGQRRQRARHSAVEVGVGRLRLVTGDDIHGELTDDPCRLAEVVSVEDAAGRVRCGPIHAGQRQRRGRHPCRVTVFSAQVRRASACRAVQLPAGRKGRIGPCVVVPAGAHHPRLPWQRLRPALDARECCLHASRSAQLDGHTTIGEAFQVDVRIDEAGPCRTPQPHDLCAATRHHACARADGEDASVRTGRDLRLAAREQNGPLLRSRSHRP